jgi:DNA-binding MarR family transcriptional regulator
MMQQDWTRIVPAPLVSAAFGLRTMSPSQTGEVALLVAGGGTQHLRLAELAGCAEVRLLGQVDYGDLADRLSQQGHLHILWLCGQTVMDLSLADKIASETERLGATIICDLEGAALDAAFADFAHLPGTQFLSQADAIDCETALAAARGAAQVRVADSAADHALERIDRLQEEVARISALLASLAERPPSSRVPSRPVSFTPMVRASESGYRAEPDLESFAGSAPARVDSATVRRMLRERRMREQFFAAELFADPAWDMLLDLYAAQLEGHPVAVSSLCIAAAVPATTALRWIKTMTDTGLLERQADPRDGRRIFIGLTDTATQAMDRYFTALESAR